MCLAFVPALQEHQLWFQCPQLKDSGKMETPFREEPQKVMKNSSR